MSAFWNDLKFACRQMIKNRGFTVVAVLTLALGIGASTAIYSVVDAVILNPMPGPEPDRLLQIAEQVYHSRDQRPLFGGVSPPVLEALRANQAFFSDLAVCSFQMLDRRTVDFTEEHSGALVSPNFFTLWNVPPLLGRTFAGDEAVPLDREEKPIRDAVIVLSHAWWRSLFHGDPDVIGKVVELSDRHFTIIGVMPSHFRFPSGATQFWLPAEDPRWYPDTMTGSNIKVLARLKPGVNEAQSLVMLAALAQRLSQDHESTYGYSDMWERRPGGLGFWTRPVRAAFQDQHQWNDLRRTLFGLLAAIGFVLLIVCANVANLALARTERRQQELAVRSALGAGRFRLMRQLLTENLLVACLGGLGGLVVTMCGVKLLMMLVPEFMPRLRTIQINGHILGVAILVSLASGLLFGLAPAWYAGQSRLGEALKQAGLGASAGVRHSRFGDMLVVVQVALALVLLTGAGLMVQSVIRLLHVDPGYDPENLLRVSVNLPWQKYAFPHREERNIILEQLHERLAALPRVEAIGIDKQNFAQKINVTHPAEAVHLYVSGCDVDENNLFRAMRVSLLAGRYLDRSDVVDAYFHESERIEGISAVVINETMARLCWPGEDPIGKIFPAPGPQARRRFEVVGLVADICDHRYDQKVEPTFYRPYHEFDLAGQAPAFVIRTAGEPYGLIPAVRRELKATEPAMNAPHIQVVRQMLYDATKAQRTYMTYLVVFAAVGLVLSAMGIYGLLAYSVTRRTREIGIRIALGAERRHILRATIAEGMRLIAVGTGVGLLAAFWLTRLLQHQLFEVSPTDPIVFTGVVLFLLAVALLACLLPARRATKVDPMEALHYE